MSYVNDSSLKLYLNGADFSNSPPTTSWTDRSGNGNNAVPYNMAYTPQSGSDGNGGVAFDGTDDYGIITNNLAFDFKNADFSIGFTVTFNVIGQMALLCKRTAYNLNNSFDIRLYGSTSLQLVYSTNGTTGKTITFPCSTLSVGTKYKLDFVRKGTSVTLYINGVSITSQNIGTDSLFTSAENIVIGALNSNGTKGYLLNGKLYNILVYNRALSQSEITQNYNDAMGINTYKKPFILSPLAGILTPMGR